MLWTINDYISKISFELRSTNFPGSYFKPITSSWLNVDKELMESSGFGGNLKHASLFKDEVEKGEATLERATQIENMIKKRVKWDEKSSLFAANLKKALNDGIGNSGQINFLLINALNAAGFDAFPVVLSTRSNGRIPLTHPSISALNYVITGVKIGENHYFTDASSRFGSWNLLPLKCMVEQARIISLNNRQQEWIDLRGVTIGTVFRQVDVNFADDMAVLKLKETRRGSDAYSARNEYSRHESQEKFTQDIEERNNCTISDFVLSGYDKNENELITEYTDQRNFELGSDFIYYTPPISKIFNENPLTAETRIYPINFNYIQTYIQLINIEIPEGYEIAEIPKSERIIMGDNQISYWYNVAVDNNKIAFNLRFQLKELMFLPNEYDNLKEFISKIINKGNEQIVLKKRIETNISKNTDEDNENAKI